MDYTVAPTSALPASIGNVTGHQIPHLAVHKPKNLEEIRALVASARERKVALYPSSTGLNWGYGSSSPATAGCEWVDLSGMNRILNADSISRSNPIAVIEPGVTQGQLYDFLQKKCPDLTFNVTGSARHTSIIGNALDRGVGYFGPRKEDLFGLEVVCGSGEVLKTGFRRLGEDSPLAHSHPFGLGPMLDGLFFQGNFGIVTSACFKLQPKRPKGVAVFLALNDNSKIGHFIDELGHLKREGLMTSVAHIANKARSQASLMSGMVDYFERVCKFPADKAKAEAEKALPIIAPNEWTSLSAITGNADQVKAALKEIRQRMKGLARVKVITDELLNTGYKVTNALRFLPIGRSFAAAISATRPLHGLSLGVPTDAAIDNLLWKYGRRDLKAVEFDASNCGLMFISPALPPNGTLIIKLIDGMNAVAAKFGQTLYITINIETPTSFVAVINILFDRSSPAETDNAHHCAHALYKEIKSKAHRLDVYRARTDAMAEIVSGDPHYWKIVRDIKLALDPDNIIAPGRYNLPQ